MEAVTDSGKLKKIFKQAIIEAIEEKKSVVHDLLVDAMEDLAMIRAVQQGGKDRIGQPRRGVRHPCGQGMNTAFTKSFAKDLKRHTKDKNPLAHIREIILEVEAVANITDIGNLLLFCVECRPLCARRSPLTVVMPVGSHHYQFFENFINHSMFVGDPARPDIAAKKS